MPAALHDALTDCFAVADARLAPLDADAVPVAETLGDDAQMHLALAPQDDFVRLRIVHDGNRRIFLGEPVKRLTEFDVVLALLGRNRDGEYRRIGFDFGDRGMRMLAGAKGFTGLGLVELGKADCIADPGGTALLRGLADEPEGTGDAAGLVVRSQKRRAVAGLPRKHAHNRHFAAVR